MSTTPVEGKTVRKSVSKLIVAALFSKTSLTTFAIKIARLIISIVALNIVSTLFKQWYADNDERIDGVLPSLRKFVVVYFAIEFCLNMIISLTMAMIVAEDVTKASLVDYVIGAAVSFKLSLSVASLFSDPKLFDYRADGMALITALEKLVVTFIVVNMFLPYYLFVRQIVY